MSDEELLLRYHKYKKRRMIIISSIVIILAIIIFILFMVNNVSSNNEVIKEPTEIIVKDDVAPEINLSVKSIEIMEGGDVEYLKYLDSVIDNIDGDLIKKIKYTEIDSSIIGEQQIVYSVSDSSGNTSQEIIIVNIIKKEEVNPEEPPKVETPPKKEDNKPSNNDTKKDPPTNIETPFKNDPKPEQEPSKIIKYFLFTDGYTMKNVAEACATELKKTNKTGICSPIQDEKGIYLGMKLETN